VFIISNVIWCQIFGLDVQWKVTIHPVLQDAKAGLLIKHSSNAQSLLLIAREDIWPRSAGEPTIGFSGEEMVYLCGNQTLAHPMQLWRLRTLSSDLTLQFSATNDPVLRPGNGFDGIFKGTEVDEPLAITPFHHHLATGGSQSSKVLSQLNLTDVFMQQRHLDGEGRMGWQTQLHRICQLGQQPAMAGHVWLLAHQHQRLPWHHGAAIHPQQQLQHGLLISTGATDEQRLLHRQVKAQPMRKQS